MVPCLPLSVQLEGYKPSRHPGNDPPKGWASMTKVYKLTLKLKLWICVSVNQPLLEVLTH